MPGKTLYDKLWATHHVCDNDDGSSLIYIDRQLLHEVTSPQAFEGLRINHREPWRLETNFAVPDHNVPTLNRAEGIADDISRIQVETLEENCKNFAIPLIELNDIRQGIVHIMGPEQGLTLPGMTIVCGDSHTSTHGALGALAFGIGTSDVEHVLATQCLIQKKMRNFRIQVDDYLGAGITAKDLILAIIGEIGTAGGTGYAIEYAGKGIEALSMEARMTVCNMTIEAGARAGLIAVDSKTLDYVKGKPYAPKDALWQKAEAAWQDLKSDPDAEFDKVLTFSAGELEPQVTWGTSPEMVLPISGKIPNPDTLNDINKKQAYSNALKYMGLQPGTPMTDIRPDRVFIGSCTNARIEDLRAAAAVVKGRVKANSVKEVLVVPGSGLVKRAAEEEGLHEIFLAAGFSWREPGCSMCLAMNADKLSSQEHCASTSNRNFEGRQGQGGRTHLMSPQMAAAAAISGHFVDVREYL